ncbi:hypothetical protein PGT21_020336 [Puccinia graminis f. sp. tritici]|uniref:Uncharacterized protein n=1 Tax=Puccinia graminis f. sp. tritici TaxID=56615 RepID=A0A5B0RLA6_PUCGR|nr:hypothetical protein PGT21_020336 [Puccinia graminis f. sp. tritici]KAA1125835.1 hypothetical protein PGTUg99_005478 [Puccinia graminis f. sp. tritici]
MKAILMSLVIVSLISNIWLVDPVIVGDKTYYVFKANSIAQGQATPPLKLIPVESMSQEGKLLKLKCKNDSDVTWYIFNGCNLSNPFTFTPKEEKNLIWTNSDPVMVATTEHDKNFEDDRLRQAANIWRTGRFQT